MEYFDLHVHSKNSFDSSISIPMVFSRARQEGLKGIAITDHDFLTWTSSPYPDLLFIPGIEIRVREINGDIIALGIQEEISPSLSLPEIIENIHDQAGVAIVPHPFSSIPGFPSLGENIYNVSQLLDGIEVTSPKSHVDNKRAKREGRKLGLAQVGGSDSHRAEHIGRGVTIIKDAIESVDELLEAIRKKKTRGEVRKICL